MSHIVRKSKILVLDGETRTALAVVRALKGEDIEIGVVASSYYSIAGSSKFADIAFLSPDNNQNPDLFRDWLHKLIKEWKPDFVIPNTDATQEIIYNDYDNFNKYPSLCMVEKDLFEKVVNKFQLLSIAKELEIHTPITKLITHQNSAEIDLSSFNFPVVLKPAQTAKKINDRITKLTAVYFNAKAEILEYLAKYPNYDFLIQEVIQGEAIGFFTICKKGEPIIEFAHKRILEKPPSGGVSVLSKSIPLAEASVEKSLLLLKHLGWDGPAMVEYKRTADGKFFLMEINTRFWGSLQLSIDSGLNFPKYYFEAFCQNRNSTQTGVIPNYKTDIYLRWTLGCFDHILIQLKHSFFSSFLDLFCKNSLRVNLFSKNYHQETFRTNDPLPFFIEVYLYIKKIFFKQ